MFKSKARKYINSLWDPNSYNIKTNLAARWGLFWSLLFILVSIGNHYLHDNIAVNYPQVHFIYWIFCFCPIIFYPLVGATGTLELKETYEKSRQIKLCHLRYDTLVENLPDIVYTSSPEDKFDIKFISPHIKTISGINDEDFYSSPDVFIDIIHPKDREFVLKRAKKISKSTQLRYRVINKNSKKCFHVIDHLIPVKEDSKLVAIEGIIVDITPEVKARKRLNALTRETINAQETERKRIAKELHDEFGQALSAIKINLNLIEQEVCSNSTNISAIKNTIKNTDKIVDTSIIELKRISLDLRPSMIDHLGLEATLYWYIKEFRKRTKINVSSTISGLDKRHPAEVEIAIYRILQEALTNILKHSTADKINITIKKVKDRINCLIEDNGRGFSIKKAFNPETRGISFGIVGMRERVKNLDGNFRITSGYDKGTKIELSVPIG